MLNVMDQQTNGEGQDLKSWNEITTSASIVDLQKLLMSIMSHPSFKTAQTNSQISLLLAKIAIYLKDPNQLNDFNETEQRN